MYFFLINIPLLEVNTVQVLDPSNIFFCDKQLHFLHQWFESSNLVQESKRQIL